VYIEIGGSRVHDIYISGDVLSCLINGIVYISVFIYPLTEIMKEIINTSLLDDGYLTELHLKLFSSNDEPQVQLGESSPFALLLITYLKMLAHNVIY
jgi:hypothetical protein